MRLRTRSVRIKELPDADLILRALQGEPPPEISLDLALLRKLRVRAAPFNGPVQVE